MYGQLASKWHRKHHVQEAKQHTDKAFYLSLYSYCLHSDWGLMRTRVCFQKVSECYQKTVPCKMAFLLGRRYWGEREVQLGLAVKGAGQEVFSWDVWITAG